MRLMSEKCILYISSTNYKLVSAGTEKFMGGLIDTFNDEGVHSVQIFPLVGFNNKLNRINPSAFYIGVNCDGKFIGAYSIEDILSAIEYIKNKYNYLKNCSWNNYWAYANLNRIHLLDKAI